MRSIRAPLRSALLVFLAVSVAGCGPAVRFAYNNADYGLRFLAHEYFDLHGAQADAVKAQLELLHAWHRHEELPRYAAAFDDAARRVERGLKREDVEWAVAILRERTRALFVQAADEAAPLLPLIDEHNIAALEKKIKSENEKYEHDFLSHDAARNERERFKRLRDRFEEWTGNLDSGQEALIAQFAHSTQNYVKPWYESRKLRQREFVDLLRTGRGSPDLSSRLQKFLLAWDQHRSPEHARLAADQERAFVQLVVDLDGTLSSKQRARAVKKLERYADDCRTLAEEGKPKAREQRAETSNLRG